MSVEPLGGITITAREIYDAVVRLTGRVDVLIEQHNGLRQDLREHELRTDTLHADYETRLRSLEKARWPLPSAAVLLSLAALAVGVLQLMH